MPSQTEFEVTAGSSLAKVWRSLTSFDHARKKRKALGELRSERRGFGDTKKVENV